ncbi:MAG: hypothetical protein ACRDZ5_12675, partial [Acidimicrobiales bacterium]
MEKAVVGESALRSRHGAALLIVGVFGRLAVEKRRRSRTQITGSVASVIIDSTPAVCRSAMLDPVYEYELGQLVNAVDDPVVAPPGREEAGQVSHERLAEPVRILGDRAAQRRQRGVADLRGKLVEVTKPLWGDAYLIHRSR